MLHEVDRREGIRGARSLIMACKAEVDRRQDREDSTGEVQAGEDGRRQQG